MKSDRNTNSKLLTYRGIRVICYVFFLLINVQIANATPVFRSCSVAGQEFRCPDGFSKPVPIDERTVVLTRKSDGSVTKLFVHYPESNIDPLVVTTSLAKKLVTELKMAGSKEFEWKVLSGGIRMDLDTKLLTSVADLLGFNGTNRVQFLGRYFSFKQKNFLVGYGYSMEDRGVDEASRGFQMALGGDNAIGCNATAEVIFSITKEKTDRDDFYCSMTVKGK